MGSWVKYTFNNTTKAKTHTEKAKPHASQLHAEHSKLNADLLLFLDIPFWCCSLIITVTQVTHCKLIWRHLPAANHQWAHRLCGKQQ